MKKVVIFGATGNTGLCTVNHALEKGFETRIFVRDEAKIPEDIKSKVEVIKGDALNIDDVSKAIKDMDAVVVVLGTRNVLTPTTDLSTGMKNIIEAMKSNNVELVSVCLSGFLFYQPEKVPTIFKSLNEDHQRMYDALKESGLKYIAVFPPHIADAPSTKYIVKHDESAGRAISKHDLGAFLVECLDQSEHYQKICGIATSV
ncbi:flavin reductase (NADPH) [Prorops nasuta]|uniref:flavin reductase (NADPH) n=1 Tax=Prorops nasuta TaxID=863751 RepID=UPI0034CE3502